MTDQIREQGTPILKIRVYGSDSVNEYLLFCALKEEIRDEYEEMPTLDVRPR